jgi:hypothetical protein
MWCLLSGMFGVPKEPRSSFRTPFSFWAAGVYPIAYQQFHIILSSPSYTLLVITNKSQSVKFVRWPVVYTSTGFVWNVDVLLRCVPTIVKSTNAGNVAWVQDQMRFKLWITWTVRRMNECIRGRPWSALAPRPFIDLLCIPLYFNPPTVLHFALSVVSYLQGRLGSHLVP